MSEKWLEINNNLKGQQQDESRKMETTDLTFKNRHLRRLGGLLNGNIACGSYPVTIKTIL